MKAIVIYPTEFGTTTHFVVPDSALLRPKDPFFLPDSQQWTAVPLHGVLINRLGKSIRQNFASAYYSQIVTAVHPFNADSSEEHDIATRWARDGALTVSQPFPADNLSPQARLLIDKAVESVSSFATLKTGDLILLARPYKSFTLKNQAADYLIPQSDGFPQLNYKVR